MSRVSGLYRGPSVSLWLLSQTAESKARIIAACRSRSLRILSYSRLSEQCESNHRHHRTRPSQLVVRLRFNGVGPVRLGRRLRARFPARPFASEPEALSASKMEMLNGI